MMTVFAPVCCRSSVLLLMQYSFLSAWRASRAFQSISWLYVMKMPVWAGKARYAFVYGCLCLL